MRYFLKINYINEFNNGNNILDLIDIGIVCEDGREFYAINWSCNFHLASEWTKENIFTYLPFRPIDTPKHVNNYWMANTGTIKEHVASFFNCRDLGISEKPQYESTEDEIVEIWTFSSAKEWVVFCNLFGNDTSFPLGFRPHCLYLQQWIYHLKYPDLLNIEISNYNPLEIAKLYKNIFNHCQYLSNIQGLKNDFE